MENNLTTFYSGQVIWWLKDQPDGMLLDMGNTITVFVCLNGVREMDEGKFRNGSITTGLVECGIREKKDPYFIFKIADLLVGNMPFNVHVATPELSVLREELKSYSEDYKEGFGRPVTFILVDTRMAVVKALRVIGLGAEISNRINALVREQIEDTSFDKEVYSDRAFRTMTKYTMSDMENLCQCWFTVE